MGCASTGPLAGAACGGGKDPVALEPGRSWAMVVVVVVDVVLMVLVVAVVEVEDGCDLTMPTQQIKWWWLTTDGKGPTGKALW